MFVIALLVLDSYDSVKGFKICMEHVGYLPKIQEVLQDKSIQQK